VKDISTHTQKYLLDLARRAISARFKKGAGGYGNIPEQAEEARGVFVTLNIRGELRGCIGNIEPEGPIYSAVSRNALLAAFDDPRFDVLTEEEFKDVEIEISVLTKPQKLEYKDSCDLLKKLNDKPGLVLKKGWKKATFLPQVWEKISKPEEFLKNLCLKARLSGNCWQREAEDGEELEISTYEVVKFSEGDFFN
jgi:hypothetical protein